MSNSLFGNPKIALGFAGGVVAIALVASVVLNEFKPGAEPEPQPVSAAPAPEAAPSKPVKQGFADGAGTGWGDVGGGDAGWGTAPQRSTASQKLSSNGPSEADPFGDAGVMGRPSTSNVSGSSRQSSSGPTITSRVAPGAPPIVRPSGKNRGSLKTTG